jgi:hypothetical protein
VYVACRGAATPGCEFDGQGLTRDLLRFGVPAFFIQHLGKIGLGHESVDVLRPENMGLLRKSLPLRFLSFVETAFLEEYRGQVDLRLQFSIQHDRRLSK